MAEATLPIEVFIKSAATQRRPRAGHGGVHDHFKTGVPHALLHNLKHNKVLHERVMMLTVRIEDVPFVRDERRIETKDMARAFSALSSATASWRRSTFRMRWLRSNLAAAVQDDGHQLLPLAPDPDRLGPAGHGDLAREAVRLDAAQRRKRDGVLPAADQPRGGAGQPGGDLVSLR